MERIESKINLYGSFEKQKYNSNLVDRISELPDSIVCHILSFIPTKEVVATSIISKRWKLLWTSVNNLDFCQELSSDELDKAEDTRFVEFVNRVLHLHDGGSLNKFSLVLYSGCSPYHVTSWIDSAITKEVNELSLFLGDDYHEDYFAMPISVFSCSSLRSLVLEGDIFVFDEMVDFCLPKLEHLEISLVHFESEEVFENFISGCPMLNYLYIHMQNFPFTYRISSTSIRQLELNFIDDDYNLILEASSLEYFTLYYFVHNIVVQKSLSSLVEVDFTISIVEDHFSRDDSYNSFIEAVRKFNCAEALKLSADVMRMLSRGHTANLSTKFKRLVKLDIEVYCCACSSLQDFIQCSDNLEVLIIHKGSMENLYDLYDVNLKWTTPAEVPKCLSNNLKEVIFYGYKSLDAEREMLRYILEHGSALEAIQISCDNDINNTQFELIQHVREFPRRSPVCEINQLPTTTI